MDQHLSEMFRRQAGEIRTNFTEDAEAMGEIMAGDVLRQKLYLETGTLGVGVRLGTYIRENDASYMLSVYDGEGNVLGRAELDASQIEDNQMVFMPIYSKISARQLYFLEVKAMEAGPGNAVTCYGVEIAAGHEGATWNGEDTGLEVVTEVTYQKVFPIAECSIAVCVALFGFWLFFEEAKKCTVSIWREVKSILKNHGKRLLLCAIAMSLIGIFFLALFPKKAYSVIKEGLPNEGSATAVGYDGPWVQALTATQQFDAVEVKFGTYMLDYREGEVCIALYEAGGGELSWEKKIAARKIKDNQYLRFLVGNDGLAAGDYRMEIWTEGFGEQPLALYVTKDGGSVVYCLSKEGKEYPIPCILGLALLTITMATCYICLFTGWKARYKELLVTALVSVMAGILLNTYVNYKGISLAGLAKNLGLGQSGQAYTISGDGVRASTKREVRYRSRGEIYSINDTICLDQLYGQVDSITIYFSGEGNLPITNTFSVYLDLGEGMISKAEAKYEYAYKGQESICIPIKEVKDIKAIWMGIAIYAKWGGDIEAIDSCWYAIEKIVLNGSLPRLSVFSWAFLIGFLVVWVVYGWQRLHIEEHLEKLENKGKYEVLLFLITASVFGGIMLFLLPIHQGPDERSHQIHAFRSIGAEAALGEIREITGVAVSGVVYNAGNQIDLEKYKDGLSTNLSSYSFSFSMNLDILKYPGAALGTLVGLLLRLPAGAVLVCGKLFALLLYMGIGALAIQVTPKWKPLFIVIFLLPVSMQQAASYSYDSFNNALSLLCIAYSLRLAFKEGKVSLFDIARLAGILFLLLYIKKVYVLLGLLILLVPWRKLPIVGWLLGKLDSWKKKVAAAACALAVLVFGSILAVVVLPRWFGAEGFMDNLFSILSYPKEMCYLVGRTVTGQMQSWLLYFSAGFGWLEGLKAGWMVWVVFVEMFLAALPAGNAAQVGENGQSWGMRKYLICVAVFALHWVMIIFSMFGWTQSLWPVSGGVLSRLLTYETIEGVQGRYFIPIIALLFLFPVPHKIQAVINRLPLRFCLFCGWTVMVAYTVVTLLNRYWI